MRGAGKAGGGRGVSVPALAAVYIGTVVGAGFASGQEVLQFFGLHGVLGFLALAVATAVLGIFGYLLLLAGHGLGATSYGPVVRHVAGPFVGRIIDAVLTFFLFGGTAAMFAGAGATLAQQYGLHYTAGLVGMAVATAGTVLLGLGGVVASISFVVPFLLAAVLAVSLWSLAAGTVDLGFAQPSLAAVPNWLLSGVSYGSYNLILAASVLAPLARLTPKPRLLPGIFLGALGLGVGALAVDLAILAHVPESTRAEVPMVLAAARISPLAAAVYSAVLLAEVYTTAVGSLYGFVNRVVGEESRLFRLLTLLVAAAAGVAAGVGFSTIVGTLYPAVGYAGFLLLGALALAYVRKRI
ncbi:MAG TPA: hypothetical protein DHW14_05775 [Clostridiales bacterium]|nr:hypothetical protein [Clostridiales bacterium]